MFSNKVHAWKESFSKWEKQMRCSEIYPFLINTYSVFYYNIFPNNTVSRNKSWAFLWLKQTSFGSGDFSSGDVSLIFWPSQDKSNKLPRIQENPRDSANRTWMNISQLSIVIFVNASPLHCAGVPHVFLQRTSRILLSLCTIYNWIRIITHAPINVSDILTKCIRDFTDLAPQPPSSLHIHTYWQPAAPHRSASSSWNVN